MLSWSSHSPLHHAFRATPERTGPWFGNRATKKHHPKAAPPGHTLRAALAISRPQLMVLDYVTSLAPISAERSAQSRPWRAIEEYSTAAERPQIAVADCHC
jgi:hypothetical protein